jgi:hypothetical protein
MAQIKSYTSLEQAKELLKILPHQSADMSFNVEKGYEVILHPYMTSPWIGVPCWSLAALLDVLPEINGIPLKIEKVKAEDGYNGYYYHIEYKDIVLIPYSKNSVDACVAMIIKLNELKLLQL